MVGPKELFAIPVCHGVLLVCGCERSDRGGECERGRPKEVVEALAEAVKALVPGASVGVTDELRVLGDGANTREL